MSPPIEHPSWCDPGSCDVRHDEQGGLAGSHASRLIPVDMGDSDQTVTVHLYQGTPDAVLVIVDIHVPSYEPGEPDHESGIILRAESARALGRILISAGREAGRAG
jgi:hypothetical protein